MNRLRNRVIALSLGVLSLALVALLAVSSLTQNTPTASAAPAAQATTAAAATPGASGQQTATGQQLVDNFSKSFAAKLNVDEGKLNGAFSEAVSDTVDQAVKDGQLNQTQAGFIKQQTKNGFKGFSSFAQTGGTGKAGMQNWSGAAQMGQYLMPVVMATSQALNLSPMELAAQVQADKSLADIAKAQNVDLQKVKDAITTSIKSQLDAAVKAGKGTQAQADLANKTVGLWIDELVNFHISAAPKGTPQDAQQYLQPVVNAVAASLNLTPEQLQSQLQSGKKLGEIARAQNVDVQNVKNAALSSSKTQLDAAVKAGKATQAQADKAYQTLTLWIDELVK